jgi:hypothetical protein
LTGVTTLQSAEEGRKEGKATVRSVHGTVQYMENNAWLPAKPNMKFDAGITIRTGADGVADISINGTSSAVRLTNNTTLQIPAMSYIGSVREWDTTTRLNLVTGSILGNVKKISASSRYEIITPHGVAGIRGTDFSVEVIPTQNGSFDVTFSSITGLITVSAVINGITVTHTLSTGTSWEIGQTPQKMTTEIEQNYQSQIIGLVQSMEIGDNIGNPGPAGNNKANAAPVNPANPDATPGNVTIPFVAGPPQGAPSS